jgi:peptidoglycan/xylan/chitin deacetylase (PgdA/CDA1 family)
MIYKIYKTYILNKSKIGYLKSKCRIVLNIVVGFLYYPLRFFNKLKSIFTSNSNFRLRVLSFHDISSQDEKKFERQIKWLMKKWDFIHPTNFEKIIEGEIKLDRDYLMLTFDDGTISNYHIAKKVLKRLDIHALFFVVTKYALFDNTNAARIFAAENIMLTSNLSEVPANFENMTIDNLKDLVKDGHCIGSHTFSHARLSNLSKSQINKEINKGAKILEGLMGMPIKHFAYPFGDIESINAEASIVASQRFKYVYTGIRGDNGKTINSTNLMRDSNHPHDSLWYTGACLEGAVDMLYSKKINSINNLQT